MRAKVINYPSGPVVAFGGIEYVAYEWRDVPGDFEDAVERHPFLEVEQPAPKPKATAAKPKRTRRRRTTKPKEVKE